MKRMKKLELLLAALVLVCLAIAAVQRLNSEEEAADAEQESITLIDVAYEDVTKLSFIYADREELTFTKDVGDWSYAADETFPLDGDYLDTMLYSVSNLTASRVLEAGEDPEEYGLTEPGCTVVINGEDGITLKLGDETSLGGECYASIGDDKIYLVDVSLFDNFDYSLLDLVTVEDIPYMDSVAAVTVVKGEESQVLDSENDAELIEALVDLYWMDCVSYKAEEELAAYGLDNAVTVTVEYVETESVDTGEVDENGEAIYETQEYQYTFTVEIGCTEEGVAYGRLPDSNQIYEVDASIAQMLEEVW